MMKKMLVFLLFPIHMVIGQEKLLNLDSCVSWSKQNYPLMKQNELIQKNSAQNLSSIRENWYPKLSFMAKATYQSEVVSLNMPGVAIALPHDSYLANVGLEQSIFDGGQTGQQRKIEEIAAQLELSKNEVEIYKVVDRVMQIYANILLLKENAAIMQLYIDDLENKKKNIAASIQNGMALESAMDELEAELLKTEQNLVEVNQNLAGGYQSLELYTGKKINAMSVFDAQPMGGSLEDQQIVRPELRMLDNQLSLLDAKYKLTNRMALPKLALNLGGNYGRPGPNFLNQNLRLFGEGSLVLRWNISSLYGLNREKNKTSIAKESVSVQREMVLLGIKTQLITQMSQIQAMNEVLEKDLVIIQKRKNVTKTAANQLENGKITLTDYLTTLNAEMQAVLNQKVHEIKRMNAITTYNTTKGIANF